MRARRIRVARAAVAATLAVFVALVAHVAAGGAAPHALGVVGPLVLALPAATLLVGRRPSLVRTSAVVAVSQLLFHVLFALGAPAAGPVAHEHGGAVVALADTPTLAIAGMPLAHLVAAAVTTLLLHRAERAVLAVRAAARVAAAWIVRLRVALAPRLAPPVPVRLVVATTEVPPRVVFFSADVSRRGPPLAAVA